MSGMLSPKQLAEEVGLSDTCVRRAINRGEIRAYKLAGRIKIDVAEAEAWKERNRVQPKPQERRESPMFEPEQRPQAAHGGSFRSKLQAIDGGRNAA